MAKYYPNFRTIVIFLVCAAAIMATLWYVRRDTEAQNTTNGSADLESITDNQNIPTNSDWKKQFFAVSGATGAALVTKPVATAPEKLTSTDIAARNFFTRYATMSQSGDINDPNAVNQAAQQLAADSMSGLPPPTTYTAKDIHVGSVANTTTVAAYGRSLVATLKYMPATSEAEIAQNAVNSGDMKMLTGIDPVIEAYGYIRTSLLAMSVPQPLAPDHLSLVNAFSIAYYDATALRNSDKDAMQALVAVSLEPTQVKMMSDSYTKIQNYFNSVGVQLGS